MPTLTQCTDEVLLALNGYGAPAPRASFLTAGIDASQTVFTVTNADDFNQGLIEVDGELMYVESVDYAANQLTISLDGRGYYGTTAAAHVANTRVSMNPVWPRVRVEAAINEAIEQTYPTLFGVSTTQIQVNPVQVEYELPEDCVQVLEVSASTPGPSQNQQKVNRYAVNLSAPSDTFPSGNSIALHEAVWAHSVLTVTYRKVPSQITSADEFTASGLRSTAWKAVRLAAMSELLNYLDAARLPLDTANSAEMAERNQIGSAARISTQLWQRYQIELQEERRRLAAETPVPINVRSR